MTETALAVPGDRADDCRAVVTAGLGIESSGVLSMTVQTGGLFNFLLRVETTGGTFYFKQYLEGAPNSTFNPPQIPASERAAHAYEVQRQAVEATAIDGSVVPKIVHFDRTRNAFLMEPARGDRLLYDYLSRGSIPGMATTALSRALGRLHQHTYGKYDESSSFGNRAFRDFKLRLQYDDVAARLSDEEAAIVMACKAEYERRAVCVTHGDPNSRNVMAGANGMGLYDFEQSHLGSPAYDLAYVLSELFIATLTFETRSDLVAAIQRFLDSYFDVFDAEARQAVEEEVSNHLAVQMIYRFWGPSRAAWTSYVPPAAQRSIVEFSKVLLSHDCNPVGSLLAPGALPVFRR